MFIHRKKMKTLAVLATSSIMFACGCSSETESNDASYPATELCNSTLESSSVRALTDLADTTRFQQSKGVKLPDLVEGLKRSAKSTKSERQKFCLVYTVETDGMPVFDIEMESRSIIPEPPNGNDWDIYELGQLTYTSDNGAYIYFHCPLKDIGVEDHYIKSSLWSAVDSDLNSKKYSRALISILNDVSFKVANELACTKKAHLRDEFPY